MEFNIIGQGDPFLHVTLNRGEKIFCESNAMVTMDATLELKAKMQGGFFSSLARKVANGESFFNQFIEATSGNGETLLASELPGDIQILDVGGTNQYFLNDGAFLAASEGVNLETKMQGIGKAIFGGTGGLFVTKTSGNGKIAVSGLGTTMEMHITPDSPMIVDNFHVVAWDQTLDYELSLSTNKGGFLSNMVNSVTSGEGVVTKFKGKGKIYVCSRNRGALVSWMKRVTAGNDAEARNQNTPQGAIGNAMNGQFDVNQLTQMMMSGQLNPQSLMNMASQGQIPMNIVTEVLRRTGF